MKRKLPRFLSTIVAPLLLAEETSYVFARLTFPYWSRLASTA